jgi:PAS domain S-box-containing protein
LRRRHDIPVIYITAYSDPDTVSRIKESEPYGYIHKPFDFRELQIVIETALIKHRLERTLREREEWFSTTLKSIGDGVIAADPKGAVTFMNATAESMTGWTLDEARGTSVDRVFRIVNEQTRKTVENPVRKVLRKGCVIGLANHTLLIRRDGASIPIDDSGAPILNGLGKVTGVVLVFKDITEKKRYERKLLESEILHRRLVETSPDAIMLIEPDGTVKWVNRRAARLFGHASTVRLVGSSAVNLVAPESLESVRQGLRILASGATIEKTAYIFVRKNGTRFPDRKSVV